MVGGDIWVVGATSILGWTLATTAARDHAVTPTCSRHNRAPQTRTWARIDVERPEDWRRLSRGAPSVLLYCAGVCDVKRCNADPHFAESINLGGVTAMLDALPASTRLLVCSSDHVFAGRPEPYVESTPPDPISVYGRTRVAAETLVLARRPDALVVRVALPIGPSMTGRVGHLDWLRDRHARGLAMTVIDGEHRAAVWASDAAERILALAGSDARGIRHLAATRPTGRPELAAALCRRLGLPGRYDVVRRDELSQPHLGHIDLRSEFTDALATPLPTVLDALKNQTPGWPKAPAPAR
ncbi:MAG: sugar nucleotide-binding protein [Myxococcota bacterium]